MSPFPPILRAIVLSAALAVPAIVSTAPANAANVTCPVVYWGSLPKTAEAAGPTETIVNVRTGAHACYDRLVVDINGSGPVGYDIRYVDTVFTEGRGDVVALAGGAKIQIVVHAPSYDINTGADHLHPDRPGTIAAADKPGRLPNLPAGRLRGQLRGTDHLRPGCSSTTADAGVRAQWTRHRAAAGR